MSIKSFPRARKARRCDGNRYDNPYCHRVIEPGERYERAAIPPKVEPFFADGWSVLIHCSSCARTGVPQ